MITKNLPTLEIHQMPKDKYDREWAAGRIKEDAIYLVEGDDESDSTSKYITEDTSGNITLSDGNGAAVLQSTGNGFAAQSVSVEQLFVNGQTIQDMIAAYVNAALLGGKW